jgi:flagellar hook-length control protein FliK
MPQAPLTARVVAVVTDQRRRSLKDSRTTMASIDAEKAQAETRQSVQGEGAADTLGAGRNDAVEQSVRSPLIENPADSRMMRTLHHPAEPRAEGLTLADRNFNNVHAELNRPPASPGVAKESPPPAESFREQNVTQIAERIAVSIRGHQSEARIALKPDHLGHLRLQIATENNTVSIRIMAELPMARDLLESHLYQLKADLQQQGLDVEEFDVTLSEEQHHFCREERRPPGRPARPSQGAFGNPANRDASVDDETQNPRRRGQPSRTSGVDYFA